MRWNWDFIRARKTEIDNSFRRAPSAAGKRITVNGHARKIQGKRL
jgi:hypothetical protein